MSEERRLVTILFADVQGSTSLGETLDPEDLRALLSRYYAIAREVIADYGGTVEKFIGDAVMAVFGLPVAHGDDAERAIGAALDLRDRVRSDARLRERLPIRLGVASGEVVARRDAAAGEDFLRAEPLKAGRNVARPRRDAFVGVGWLSSSGWLTKHEEVTVAELSTNKRKKLPDSSFGLPDERKYPMPDDAHARNAKARAAQQEEKGRITAGEERKIDRKANRILDR